MKELIDQHIRVFKTISLGEMDEVALLHRKNEKYIFHISKLPSILSEIKNYYQILQINQTISQPYYSIYFDTLHYDMYLRHHDGKVNRHKIRYRYYQSSNKGFLEIKFKNNKRVTSKTRVTFDFYSQSLEDAALFIKKNSPYFPEELLPKTIISYNRLTFVDIANGERVTCDFNLNTADYNNPLNNINFNHICIIEVKKNKFNHNSVIMSVLKKHRIFTNKISKYCIGTASLQKKLKQNRFKYKLRMIQKLGSHNTNHLQL